MGRREQAAEEKALQQLLTQYEASKSEGRSIYLDGDQLADIAGRYTTEQRYQEAQEVIDYGLRLHPEHPYLLLEQAYLFLDLRRPHDAEAVVNRLYEQQLPEVILLKAELQLTKGAIDEAETLLEGLDGKELDNIIDATYLYVEMGYPEQAKQWLDKGVGRYDDHEAYLALCADYRLATGDSVAAVDAFEKLIDLDPYNDSYWLGRARALYLQQNFEEAIVACDFALTINEHNGEAYTYLGHSFLQLENVEAALKNFKLALQHRALSPEMGQLFIGTALLTGGRWQEAYDTFDQAIALYEQTPNKAPFYLTDLYIQQAMACVYLERFDEAHDCCEKALAVNSDDINAYVTEGMVYLNEGKASEALITFQIALKIDRSIETLYAIASYLFDFGLLKEADQLFREVFEEDRHYKDTAEKLATISLLQGESDSFIHYNHFASHPIDRETVLDLMKHPHYDATENRDALLKALTYLDSYYRNH